MNEDTLNGTLLYSAVTNICKCLEDASDFKGLRVRERHQAFKRETKTVSHLRESEL